MYHWLADAVRGLGKWKGKDKIASEASSYRMIDNSSPMLPKGTRIKCISTSAMYDVFFSMLAMLHEGM